MADVTLERKQALSREEAAGWLPVLSPAFPREGDVRLPVGDGGTVGLHLPEHVEAEVDVDGGEVQAAVEFTRSTPRAVADDDPTTADA